MGNLRDREPLTLHCTVNARRPCRMLVAACLVALCATGGRADEPGNAQPSADVEKIRRILATEVEQRSWSDREMYGQPTVDLDVLWQQEFGKTPCNQYHAEFGQLLSDESPLVRRRAVSFLGEMQADACAELGLIRRCLEDPDDRVRYAAIVALSEIGEATFIDPIARAARSDRDSLNRREAIEQLGNITDKSARALTAIGPADPDPEVCAATLRERGRLAKIVDGYLPDVIKATFDTRGYYVALSDHLSIAHSVQHAAWEALASFGKLASPALPMLKASLQKDDLALAQRRVLAVAVESVNPGDGEGLSVLLAMLNDPEEESFWSRSDTIDALGTLGSAAEPAVKDLLQIVRADFKVKYAEDDDLVDLLNLKSHAANALARIAPQRKEVVSALGDYLLRLRSPILVKDYYYHGVTIQFETAFTLEAIGQLGPHGRTLMPQLAACLLDTRDAYVRVHAAYAIARVAAPEDAATLLTRELRSASDEYLQVHLIEALGTLTPCRVTLVPVLQEFLSSDTPAVRKAATAAIEQLNSME